MIKMWINVSGWLWGLMYSALMWLKFDVTVKVPSFIARVIITFFFYQV